MATRENPDDPTGGVATTTKYSVRPETEAEHDTATNSEYRWRHAHGHPRITKHAQEMWDERTPPGSVSPETAWEHAVGVGEELSDWFKDATGQTPGDVRQYHGETPAGERYTMLFLVCGERGDGGDEYHVRTVYQEDEDAGKIQALLAMVRWQCTRMHGGADAADTPQELVFEEAFLPRSFVRALAAAHGFEVERDGGA